MQAPAIGFDFDHTLGIDNKLEVVAFVTLVQRISETSHLRFDAQQATAAISAEIERYRSGVCSLEDAVGAAFDNAVDDRMGERAIVDAFRALAVELAPSYVQALPGVPELLASLDASKIAYAILTNGWNPLQQCKADCIGFHGAVFVSDDIGVRKPSVHAFNILSDHFGLPADRIWYVGDDPRIDVVGSLGAGMRAIWCDAEGRLYPTDIPAPTAIVTDIRDVVDVVAS